MDDLINRKALLDSLEKEQEIYENNMSSPSFWTALSVIEHMQPVEAVPVVHGEWIGGKWYKECSVCSEVFTPTTTLPNFCPNCGADMRKKV